MGRAGHQDKAAGVAAASRQARQPGPGAPAPSGPSAVRCRSSGGSDAEHKTGWAGSAKLTWAQVVQLRAYRGLARWDLAVLAEHWRLHPETLRRAYLGKSWPHPKTKRLPEEYKRCVICGALFPRCFLNGRRRTPAHWRQKQTCGRSCALTHHWRRGCYANRH